MGMFIPDSRVCTLGMAKQDLWVLEQSQRVVASCPFAKMIPQCNGKIILAKQDKFCLKKNILDYLHFQEPYKLF